MKRVLTIVASVVLVAVAAVWFLRRGPAEKARSDDPELATQGQFLSDSLGVGLLLPSSPGWSFERPASILGAPYMTVLHDTDKASVRFFVHPKAQVGTLAEVIQRRRDRLAAGFRVDDIDNVVEQILLEGQQEVQGFPAWQWQALTEPVAIAGEEPAKVMYLIQIVERALHIFEVVGIVRVPLSPTPEEHAANATLQGDVGFILQSFQVR